MSLSELFGATIDAPVASIKRQVLAYAIGGVSAIGALIYGASAATRALESLIGPAEARGVIALGFAIIAVGSFLAPRFLATKGPVESAQARVNAMSREEKVSMVLDALRFGFTMGSRKPAPETNDGRK